MLRSRIFYGWWNWLHVPLLLASIAFTFLAAQAIQQKVLAGQTDRANVITMVAILANLVLLAYFKYAHFIVQSLTTALGLEYSDPIQIALPLGISFYTFTQIAFLVDTHRGKAAEYRPANYALFVTYFPHLIAGPILHHREMMPQFERAGKNKNTWPDLAAGLTILFFGLFKKTVLADGVAPYATAAFDAAASGHPLTLLESWGGALAYTFQIYFDFSGYTDMAIGLSLMLGIRLPQNFYSPYKATNIIEFWRR